MPNAHIYCHFCGSIQPLVVDEPQTGEDSRFDCATDLVCAACQFVVATAYTPRLDEVASAGGPTARSASRACARHPAIHGA
jgi:hypothetical protein